MAVRLVERSDECKGGEDIKDDLLPLLHEKINAVYRARGFLPEKGEKYYTKGGGLGIAGKKLNILAEYKCLAAMIEGLQSLGLEIPFEICISDAAAPSDTLGKRPPQHRTRVSRDVVCLYRFLTKAYPDLATKIFFFPGMVKSRQCYSKVFFEFRATPSSGEAICIGSGGRQQGREGEGLRVSGSLDLSRIYEIYLKGQAAKEKINNKDKTFIVFDQDKYMDKALELHRTLSFPTEISLLSDCPLEEQIQYAKEKGYRSILAVKGNNGFSMIYLGDKAKPEATFKTGQDLLAHVCC